MRSCTRRPTGLSANAVTTAVSMPKQRRSPRATLYSPPPSQTRKLRVVAMRESQGSSRSITSPRLTRSHLHSDFALIVSDGIRSFAIRLRIGAASQRKPVLRRRHALGLLLRRRLGESQLTRDVAARRRQCSSDVALLLLNAHRR